MAQGEQIGLSGGAPRLLVVADDLTGALDAAAPFADRGLRVRVATSPEFLAAALQGADVAAVSTRSRELAPDAARMAVAGVLAALPAGVALFKKVDSRLKGNIAAELSAFPAGPVLAVPALPEFGRIVRDGAVRGFGVPQPIAVAPLIGRPAQVPDVETPEQMAAAISAAGGALFVGARGAAVALARGMASGRASLPSAGLPMLVVVGSTDPITRAQVDRLHTLTGLAVVAAPDGQATPAPASGVTLLHAVPGPGATPPQVAATLGQAARAAAAGAASLVLTGGATAEAVLDALGVGVLDLHGDIVPGLPLSSGGAWTIVTKSGGFGAPDVLLRLALQAGG
jgi:uncharacterized protein YgbK (DUF1537 family)